MTRTRVEAVVAEQVRRALEGEQLLDLVGDY